jgi:hypothetical protein
VKTERVSVLLTLARRFAVSGALYPDNDAFIAHKINVVALRGNSPSLT